MVSWFTYLLVTIVALGQDYYSYTADEFFELDAVNKTIDVNNMDVDLLEAAVFHASNQVRTKKRKAEFTHDVILHKAARHHAVYLAKANKVEHKNTKEKRFETPYKRVVAFGGNDFMGVSENLALISPVVLGKDNLYYMKDGQPVDKAGNKLPLKTYKEFATQVVDGWMNSKGHRKNLMSESTLLGCAISGVSFNRDNLPQVTFVQNLGYK